MNDGIDGIDGIIVIGVDDLCAKRINRMFKSRL